MNAFRLPALAAAAHLLSLPSALPAAGETRGGLGESDWRGIRAAHEAWQHEFRQEGGTWQALNPGQQWTTRIDARGFQTTPHTGGWTWGLELESYGRGERQQSVRGTPVVTAEGQRLSCQRDAVVREWWVNDTRGLEHGFIVARRPESSGPAGASEQPDLVFVLRTRGSLRPSVRAGTQGVVFLDTAGAAVLNYTGLKVWDADGRALTARFEAVGERGLHLRVADQGARYPVTIDPVAQQASLKASNTGALDHFGTSVAVSGDTVVIGAPDEDSGTTGVNRLPDESATDSGAAYVFQRSGGVWSQQAYLKAGNTGAGDAFGTAVAVSWDTVVVGAPWEDGSAVGVNGTPDEGASSAGAVYVFTRNGSVWSQQAYLKAAHAQLGDRFGSSVAVSGDTVIVGAPDEDSGTTGVNTTPDEEATNAGAAYVFQRSDGVWSQQAYLKAGNTGAVDAFGTAVAVSGDTVVVGALGEDSGTTGVNSTPNEYAPDSGAAYVFQRNGGVWSQQAYLKAANAEAFDMFGHAVAVSVDTVVVGAFWEASSTTGVNSAPNNVASQTGAAYVFTRVGSQWSQQAYLKASNTTAADHFGHSVAVSGDTVVVGARFEDSGTTGVNSTPDEGATNSGAAYVFRRDNNEWSQQAYLKASNTGENDWFGHSVAVSGDTVVVGIRLEDSGATGVNSTPDESATDSGAAAVFTGFGAATGITLSGNGVEIAPGDAVPSQADHTDFGVVTLAQGPVSRTFTVRNQTSQPLLLAGTPRVRIGGMHASDFQVTELPASSVAGMDATTFTIHFEPSARFVRSATVSMAGSDPDIPIFSFAIQGTGIDKPDTKNPSLKLATPSGKGVSATSPLMVAGTAGDDFMVQRVEVTLNGGAAVLADLGASSKPSAVPFSAPLVPVPGDNTLTLTAYDPSGNSTSVTRVFTFERRYLLTLVRQVPEGLEATPDKAGRLALQAATAKHASALSKGSLQTSQVLPGTQMAVTAAAKAGHLFSHWTGLPEGALVRGHVAVFPMPEGDVSVAAVFVENPLTQGALAALGPMPVFQGLLRPDETTPPGNDTVGFLSAAIVPAKGSLSGRLWMDGLVSAFTGALHADGSVWFKAGKEMTSVLPFAGRELTMTWDESGLAMTVTRQVDEVQQVSEGQAKPPLYSKASPVRGALLDAKGKQGYFTVALPAVPQSPAKLKAEYPQGAGHAGLTLLSKGTLRLAGTLAEGTKITAAAYLAEDDEAEVFIVLPTPGGKLKAGSVLGTWVFDEAQTDSDVGSPDLVWFRPQAQSQASQVQAYRSGWPQGLVLGLIGAKYDKTSTAQTTLGFAGPGMLNFAEGQLTAEVEISNFSVSGNTVTKTPTTDKSFRLSFTQSTGLMKGTFTPNWDSPASQLPGFTGVLLGKGANRGGWGSFLSNRAGDLDPESGSVTLGQDSN